jgi:predicted DNA-binding transcriptional regulator AlpA
MSTLIRRFYTPREVCLLGGFSRSYLYRAEKYGVCPPGRRFSARCCRFEKSQIDQWLETGSWSPLPWQQNDGVDKD